MQWGDEWSDLPEPPVVFIDRDTGRTLDPVLVDRHTGQPLAELKVQAIGVDLRPDATA